MKLKTGATEGMMRKPMGWLMVALLVGVPVIGVLAAAAYASDLCFSGDGLPWTIVIKDVAPGKGNATKEINNALKKANRCQQFSGFTQPNNLFVNASVCTDSTGEHATLIANGLNFSTQIEFDLPIPQTGNGSLLFVTATSSTSVSPFIDACDPSVIPVP